MALQSQLNLHPQTRGSTLVDVLINKSVFKYRCCL